jgi:hypothetical protein
VAAPAVTLKGCFLGLAQSLRQAACLQVLPPDPAQSKIPPANSCLLNIGPDQFHGPPGLGRFCDLVLGLLHGCIARMTAS